MKIKTLLCVCVSKKEIARCVNKIWYVLIYYRQKYASQFVSFDVPVHPNGRSEVARMFV